MLPLSVSAAASKGGQNKSPVQLWCRKTPSVVKGAQQSDPWNGKHMPEWHLAVKLHTLSLMFTAATTFNLSRTLSAIKSSAKMSVSFMRSGRSSTSQGSVNLCWFTAKASLSPSRVIPPAPHQGRVLADRGYRSSHSLSFFAQVLGAPTEDTWPGLSKLPNYNPGRI